MLPLERHRLIVELLGQHGVMRVNEIAQATRVSRETIRRDLSELERKGILTRSHGGALAAENPLPATRAAASALPVEDSQGSFQHRTLLHSEGKMRVARKALQFLQPGQTIVLDGSSTSWFLARQMPEMALTVITPSIRILQTLMSRRSLHLVGLGGDFSPTEESFFGETASPHRMKRTPCSSSLSYSSTRCLKSETASSSPFFTAFPRKEHINGSSFFLLYKTRS